MVNSTIIIFLIAIIAVVVFVLYAIIYVIPKSISRIINSKKKEKKFSKNSTYIRVLKKKWATDLLISKKALKTIIKL